MLLASWFLHWHSHVGLAFLTVQNQLPRQRCHAQWVEHASTNNQDNTIQACPHANLIWAIPQVKFLLSRDSGLCKIEVKASWDNLGLIILQILQILLNSVTGLRLRRQDHCPVENYNAILCFGYSFFLHVIS